MRPQCTAWRAGGFQSRPFLFPVLSFFQYDPLTNAVRPRAQLPPFPPAFLPGPRHASEQRLSDRPLLSQCAFCTFFLLLLFQFRAIPSSAQSYAWLCFLKSLLAGPGGHKGCQRLNSDGPRARQAPTLLCHITPIPVEGTQRQPRSPSSRSICRRAWESPDSFPVCSEGQRKRPRALSLAKAASAPTQVTHSTAT